MSEQDIEIALERCPACQQEQVSLRKFNDGNVIDCAACGRFAITREAADDNALQDPPNWWTAKRRAVLAHRLRRRTGFKLVQGESIPELNNSTIQRFRSDDPQLPTRLQQADYAIRFIGDLEAQLGEVPHLLPDGTWAYFGCVSSQAAADLLRDLASEGMIDAGLKVHALAAGEYSVVRVQNYRLSLKGWRRWDELRHGAAQSRDGFIAMQFGDERLDAFISDVLITGVRDALDIEVRRVDSPDTVKAGLIDNVMREGIEDAAFVLVELSHGNRGAYWEAGLAEGLGKPVIYLCEKSAWDNAASRPHFDVNHRTTVMWDEANPVEFVTKLVATIKNSLRHRYN